MNNLTRTPPFSDNITPIEIFRNLRNYLAAQFVGATQDDVLLEEVLKCLFCKLYMEMGAGEPLPKSATRFEQARHVKSIFAKVRADFPDIYAKDAEILLDPDSIAEVMTQCAFSLLLAENDPIGDAFEVFVASESRRKVGPVFTPRVVTDFLVKAVDPKPWELIIDPACGVGGFLASVARYYIEKGIEFNKFSEDLGATLHGIDKDDYFVKLATLHISLITGCHPRMVCADSIALPNSVPNVFNADLSEEGFDVVLTNPSFDSRIATANSEVLQQFELAKKWQQDSVNGRWYPTATMQSQVLLQVLFVERCLSLLKSGGRLGMVIPESLLSSQYYRYVVEYIFAQCEVQAVMGLPEALFKTSGTGSTYAKTCLLIAYKKSRQKNRNKSIFMAEANKCGYYSHAKIMSRNDLPEIGKKLASFKREQYFEETRLGFKVFKERISSNVLCPRYYDPQIEKELMELKNTHHLLVIGDLVKQGILHVATGDELGKLAYSTGDIPFIRTSDISHWELKAEPKPGVDREIYNSLRAKQDVQANDILMVKDGTYFIGTCAIISEYDTEIIYHSHLYKIRVNKNDLGINPFILLASLSSVVVQRQIRAKQFAQDIIDSLDERINELVLPIPKSQEIQQKITEMVQAAVQARVKARYLAKKARMAVISLQAEKAVL
jgi:type I restriction enzyme M protein